MGLNLVFTVEVPRFIQGVTLLAFAMGIPGAAAILAYGHVFDRPGIPTTPPPQDQWVSHVIEATSLHQVMVVTWIGILFLTVVFIGAGLAGDADDDGIRTVREFYIGTDPSTTNPDIDGDGLSIDLERRAGLDPSDSDTDDDGVPDGEEQLTRRMTKPDYLERESRPLRIKAIPGELFRTSAHRSSKVVDAGPQIGHTIEVRKREGPVEATVIVPVRSRTIQMQPSPNAYAFRTGHWDGKSWTDIWVELPTKVDSTNQTVHIDLSANDTRQLAFILLSSEEKVRKTTTTQKKLPDNRLWVMNSTAGWDTAGSVNSTNGTLRFGGSSTARAERSVHLGDERNQTLYAQMETGPPLNVHVSDGSKNRSNTTTNGSLQMSLSEFANSTVSITLQGKHGAGIDWIWFRKDSDGDTYSNAVERSTKRIPGQVFCRQDADTVLFDWKPVDMDPTKKDSDNDGIDDNEEVHLSTTVYDEINRSVKVSLSGYHSHPRKPRVPFGSENTTVC
jgi:hypothetical protein